MKFTITKFEPFTSSAGKAYARTTLKNDAGTLYENVTIFGTHPGYLDLKEGVFVEGELTPNDYNGRKGWKMQALVQAPAWATSGPTGAGKGGGIAKAQERKAESIAKTMDRKEDGIKVSATFRDATLLTTMYFHGRLDSSVAPMEMVQAKWLWLEFRKWLWDHWDDLTPPSLPL